MSNQHLECGQLDLASLLAVGGECAVEDQALKHLENCSSCQRRLEALAASDQWWRDCQTNLASAESQQGQVASHEDTCWFQTDPSEMLAPPSHPEMLGRIGRYEVEKLLGRGGMGIVFKAFDSELHRPVAIKVLAPHLAGSGAARQRFGREGRAAAAVAHEHVVAVHDVEVNSTPPYLVMQYVPGDTLQSHVDRHGPLEASDVIRIGHQIAAGLAAAHEQGLIHRDIKPGNIMLENGFGRVVITDFGLARAADDASLTRSGIVTGTPHYMSPEQARGEPTDARGDLFSLGAVLYFMAAGHPPFRAEQAMAVLHRICHDRQRSLYEINPSIPDSLVMVIERLLEKKSIRRFTSATEVQNALGCILNDPRAIAHEHHWFNGKSWTRWHLGIVSAALLLFAIACLWIFAAPQFFTRTSVANGNNPSAGTHNFDELVQTTVDASGEQRDVTKELESIDQSLHDIETRRFPEADTNDSTLNPWSNEMSRAWDEVGRLESTWSSGQDSHSTFNFLFGETR